MRRKDPNTHFSIKIKLLGGKGIKRLGRRGPNALKNNKLSGLKINQR